MILDYGEVLCHRPPDATFHEMARMLGVEHVDFEQRYHHHRLPYDQGVLSAQQYWSAVAGSNKVDAALLARVRKLDVDMWCDFDGTMLGWIPRLREAGYKTALLSNMPEDMAERTRNSFEWLRHLDFCLLSCEWKLIKPAAEIYRVCVEGLGVPAAESLFIDDRQTNVTGAREAGLQSIRFTSVAQLRSDLGAAGVTVLP